jgi:hypothetical protein
VLALAPRHINRDGNANDAAHRLHPRSPINSCCDIGAVVDASLTSFLVLRGEL